MNDDNKMPVFPQVDRALKNLIEDEEGNIPGNKLLAIGSMIIILGTLLSADAFAKHSSHRSHSSHCSHSSHSSGSSGYHASHSSHTSHTSHSSDAHSNVVPHSSHASHTSHSNTAAHSNSLYSAEGNVTYHAPDVSSIKPPRALEMSTKIAPFEVNQNLIQTPLDTPAHNLQKALKIAAVFDPTDSNEI